MTEGKHVLYFAIQPPPEAVEQAQGRLEDLRRERRSSARPTPPERLHISLNGLGAFRRPPGPVIEKAKDAAATVRARPFAVALNRMATWQAGAAPWPLVLSGDEGVIGVEALYATLHRALVGHGMVQRRMVEIVPHLTLARDGAVTPETIVEPVSWTVRDFVLIHSVHGEGRYDVVGRWPLSA